MGTASQSSSISTAIVRVVHDHTGRGPEKVRTIINPGVIVVTLRECLTSSERQLVDHGQQAAVLALRRVFQDEMRSEMIDIIERITGGEVEAFLSDNLADPDIAVEVFVMRSSPPSS